jgi:serine protease Do
VESRSEALAGWTTEQPSQPGNLFGFNPSTSRHQAAGLAHRFGTQRPKGGYRAMPIRQLSCLLPSSATAWRAAGQLLLWLIVSTSLISASAAAQIDFDLFRSLEPSIFKVETANGDGSVSIGTAVVVGRGVVATNCHVTRRAQAITLVRGGDRHAVESEYTDIEHDLCLLYAPRVEDAPPVSIDGRQPRSGQPVFSIGFSLGIAPRISEGEINAVYEYEGGRVIETTAAFGSGASGGGLFDTDGQLVGLITFMAMGREIRHFCLPVRWVSEALGHFVGQPVAPLSGMSFWQRPVSGQPYFLRAVTFESQRNWPAMADVSHQWVAAETDNPSSWFSLAKAYGELHESDHSIDAYRHAVAIETDFASAWFGLGFAYAEACRQEESAQVQSQLVALDQQLAAELAAHQVYCPAGSSQSGQ